MKEHFDFSCWVIKYSISSVRGMTYQRDSLKSSDGAIVPLLWNHNHVDSESLMGHALLEHREDGVYAYCTVNEFPVKEYVTQLIRDKGSVSLSPYITQAKFNEKLISHGIIKEVSLVLARVDPDEAYYPTMKENT